jgi:hypothetical protein
MRSSHIGKSFKNSVAVEIQVFHSQTIHKQPFPLTHCCGIGDLPSVASEAQTNGSPTVQGQDYRIIGLQDYTSDWLNVAPFVALAVSYRRIKCLINTKAKG